MINIQKCTLYVTMHASVSTHSPSIVNRTTATGQRGSCKDNSVRDYRANTPIKIVLFQPSPMGATDLLNTSTL